MWTTPPEPYEYWNQSKKLWEGGMTATIHMQDPQEIQLKQIFN
jgi:hypothetical protein